VAQATRALLDLGVLSTTLALKVAAATGQPRDPATRKRIADALRKRASRVTASPGFPNEGAGDADGLMASSILKGGQPMPRLLKRTITTEEYVEETKDVSPEKEVEDLDELDEAENDDCEVNDESDDEEEEESAPVPAKRSYSRRRP
jgi:hypothetical protein